MTAPTLQFMLTIRLTSSRSDSAPDSRPCARNIGTLVAIPIALVLHRYAGDADSRWPSWSCSLIGVWASGVTAHALGTPDHGSIVVDEVVAFSSFFTSPASRRCASRSRSPCSASSTS